MLPDQLHFFEPGDETTVVERHLPHWQQAGVVSFITWRTHDSMPEHIVKAWQSERIEWLIAHHLPIKTAYQPNAYQLLPNDLQHEFLRLFQNRWMTALDKCHGECVLRNPQLASMVSKSLHHFDGQRYLLTDYIIMPNHVHLLVAFPDNESMLTQCESWKRYTANQINQSLQRSGRFWQQDGFDHLVRSESQFRFLRDYLRDNPRFAKLATGEFIHYSRKDV